MDPRTVGSTLMANRVLPVTYAVGSLALLAAAIVLLAGPRPRSAARRTVGAMLGVFGLALVLPALVLGIAANSAPAAMTPTPTARPGEELISCSSDGRLPPLPAAPPAGCVLVIEWGQEEGPPTGLLATTGPLPLAATQPGRWWYCSPAAAQAHIEAFRGRYPDLPVEDRR